MPIHLFFPPSYRPTRLRRAVAAALACLVVASLPSPLAAVDLAVDQAQQLDPLVKLPPEMATFSKRLLPLWEQALERPDVEPRRLAIDTIRLAKGRGMEGLEVTVPRLTKALVEETDPQLRRAAAGALVALDASSAAAELAAAAGRDGLLLARLVDPALARWNHLPSREGWLARLEDSSTHPGLRLLAIEALGTAREPRAATTLATLVADRDLSPEVRLAAARALGNVSESGLLDAAEGLAATTAGAAPATGPAALPRLLAVALLGRQSGEATTTLLRRLATDPEPSVATMALSRLDALDPAAALTIAHESLAVPDAGQRFLAARLTARPGDVDCIGRLGPLLGDRNPSLRRFVAGTLADFGADASLRQPVIDQGLAALGSDPWRALEQAALLLGHLDHEPAAERLLTLLDHDRDEVAVSAAWALRKLEIAETLPPLLAYATKLRAELQGQAPPEILAKLGRQAQQLHQLFGILRYREADPLLREYVPKAQIDTRARSSAFWALGLIHENERNCDLAPVFAERLADVTSLPPESGIVRWMAAVGLGRFKAESQMETLRQFAERDTMFVESGIASYWAIEQITGEPMPPEPVDVTRIGGWFLEPP
jgi:HEAT repeat protein